MPGFLLNFAIGKENKVIPEFGVLFPTTFENNTFSETYYHVGIAFKFGGN